MMAIFIFVLGILIGSFFNVCIYRLPRDKGVVRGRSFCPKCKKRIAWQDNIPVLSFLFLRGQCRNCKKTISWLYPLIEISTGLLFLFSLLAWGITYHFFYYVTFLSLLMMISIIDIEHRIIPDQLSLGGSIVGILFALAHPTMPWWHSIVGFILGGGIFFAVGTLYEKLTGQEGLGGGDVKLLAMIGAWIGFSPLIFVIASGSILGSVYGAFVMFFQKKGMKTAIPYGPFLAGGALIALYFEDTLNLLLY